MSRHLLHETCRSARHPVLTRVQKVAMVSVDPAMQRRCLGNAQRLRVVVPLRSASAARGEAMRGTGNAARRRRRKSAVPGSLANPASPGRRRKLRRRLHHRRHLRTGQRGSHGDLTRRRRRRSKPARRRHHRRRGRPMAAKWRRPTSRRKLRFTLQLHLRQSLRRKKWMMILSTTKISRKRMTRRSISPRLNPRRRLPRANRQMGHPTRSLSDRCPRSLFVHRHLRWGRSRQSQRQPLRRQRRAKMRGWRGSHRCRLRRTWAGSGEGDSWPSTSRPCPSSTWLAAPRLRSVRRLQGFVTCETCKSRASWASRLETFSSRSHSRTSSSFLPASP
mmetsp:Transcript_27300/g.64148  ORF Transcript_27300/g.64148 Transcript_27300/m.64148 type:complete len:333 (-) Transcript_27300:2040-3038(-)